MHFQHEELEHKEKAAVLFEEYHLTLKEHRRAQQRVAAATADLGAMVRDVERAKIAMWQHNQKKPRNWMA